MKTYDEDGSRAAYDRQRYLARKQQLIEYLGGVCVDCGTSETLEFDHEDRMTKQFAITSNWNRPLEELIDELDKCVLRCEDHHSEKTRAERSVEHGGGLSGKRNCPCSPCKAKKAEYNREHYKRRSGC